MRTESKALKVAVVGLGWWGKQSIRDLADPDRDLAPGGWKDGRDLPGLTPASREGCAHGLGPRTFGAIGH